MKIDEAYFGVMLPEHSGPTKGNTRLRLYNIFDHQDVRRAISIYKTGDIMIDDPLFFCFAGFWKRSQYEYRISDGFRTPIKIDVYDLYIEPNKEYLLKIIDLIDKKDCKKWLKEHYYGM